MQTYYEVKFRNDSEGRASVSLTADTAADALREAARILGMDTDPFTQTYTMALVAIPYNPSLNPPPGTNRAQPEGNHAMTYTTQKQVRTAFWEAHPRFPRRRIRYGWTKDAPLVYPTTIRCAFVDFIDHLQKDGQISADLAARVTL